MTDSRTPFLHFAMIISFAKFVCSFFRSFVLSFSIPHSFRLQKSKVFYFFFIAPVFLSHGIENFTSDSQMNLSFLLFFLHFFCNLHSIFYNQTLQALVFLLSPSNFLFVTSCQYVGSMLKVIQPIKVQLTGSSRPKQ